MTTGEDPFGGFGVSLAFGPGHAVLCVRGDVDLLSAPELRAVLDAVIDRGHRRVVVDLAPLAFTDLSGLRVIAAAAERLGLSGGVLTIRSPSAMVMRVLAVTGLSAVVGVESADPEAHRVGPDHAGRSLGPDRLGPDRLGSEQSARTRGPPAEVARDGGRVTVIPADIDVVDKALRLVVALARATVGGADGVSVSLRRHGRLATVAASDRTVSDLDADQYATGEGPCVDASLEGRWFHAESLHTETRWPSFTPRADALGIRSILSSPLLAGDRPVGALNVYSRTVVAFTPADQRLASVFAAEASTILAEAEIDVPVDQSARRLQRALRAREVIILAQGVLMERDGVGADDAYTALRRFTLGNDKPMRDWAADVVTSTRRSWRQLPMPGEDVSSG